MAESMMDLRRRLDDRNQRLAEFEARINTLQKKVDSQPKAQRQTKRTPPPSEPPASRPKRDEVDRRAEEIIAERLSELKRRGTTDRTVTERDRRIARARAARELATGRQTRTKSEKREDRRRAFLDERAKRRASGRGVGIPARSPNRHAGILHDDKDMENIQKWRDRRIDEREVGLARRDARNFTPLGKDRQPNPERIGNRLDPRTGRPAPSLEGIEDEEPVNLRNLHPDGRTLFPGITVPPVQGGRVREEAAPTFFSAVDDPYEDMARMARMRARAAGRSEPTTRDLLAAERNMTPKRFFATPESRANTFI